MSLQVVVPYLAAPWCLEDLLESFGPSDIPVLVVDNSPDQYCSRLGVLFPPNVEIVACPQNIGASAAWNLGLRRGADQTLICSQWVRFSPMEHSRRPASWGLDHIARGVEGHASEYGLTFGDQGYHLISVGRKTVEIVGEFDENLWFYGNDDDYHRRLDLAGIRGGINDWGDWRDNGVYSMAFGAHKRGGFNVDHDRTQLAHHYYIAKWGPNYNDYDHPFNDQSMTLRDWPPVQLECGESA